MRLYLRMLLSEVAARVSQNLRLLSKRCLRLLVQLLLLLKPDVGYWVTIQAGTEM